MLSLALGACIGVLSGLFAMRIAGQRQRGTPKFFGRLTGWGVAMRQGDRMVLVEEGGKEELYEVHAITYSREAGDVWRAEVVFIGARSRMPPPA